MKKSIFQISRMDCSAEEQLVRMKLDSVSGVRHLSFDLPNRRLEVFHEGDLDPIGYRVDFAFS